MSEASEVCCAKGCSSGRKTSEAPVSFFRFPTNELIRALWTAVLGDEIWKPSESDTVCSLHFKKSDFLSNLPGESLQLVSDAVPSLLLGEDELAAGDDVQLTAEEGLSEEAMSIVEDTSTSDFPGKNYAHLANQVNVDKNASREQLLEQLKRSYNERNVLRKRLRVLRRRNVRAIEKIAKECEKRAPSKSAEEIATEPEAKRKKKQEPQAKIYPKTLEEVLTYLETQDLVSSRAISILKVFLGNSLTEPISCEPKVGHPGKDKEVEISSVMKTFAKTLLFYSSEAYHMVKELFHLPIPAASVSRTWYNMGLGLPGWSSEAFLLLKDEIQKCEGTHLQSCILMKEFDLNASASFDEEVRGHIDIGTTGDIEGFHNTENLPLAKSALFFMLVPIDPCKKWKIPLAYFLVETLSPEERANLLMECLWRVYNMGSVVVSVVFDANVNSRQTIECLGISFEELPYPCTSFPHPADGLLNVQVIFDVPSILDILRHTWASISVMVDEKGGAIHWKYFTELVKVQETQAGCSEQTDQTATWYWDRSLMRKRLIAQLFTKHVANSIECCLSSLMLPQFSGSESTVSFIRLICTIQDIFDSKSVLLRKGSNAEWKKRIVEALNYLFVLRDRTGQGIFATNCKAPFVCLYINLVSLLELCGKVSPQAISQLSLDGLELLYIGIRSRANWEDSLSVCKFTAAYSLLLQEEGFAFEDNMMKTDSYLWLDSLDMATVRKGGLEMKKPILKFENTPPIPKFLTFYPVLLPSELQRFRASQLVMVHTVKRVAEVLYCNTCIEGLQMTYIQDNPTLVLLRMTCGGFVYPSQGVVEVCALASRHLKTKLRTASLDAKHDIFSRRCSLIIQSVCSSVMQDIINCCKSPFPQLENHCMECPSMSNHLYRLIRLLTASFVLLKLQSARTWCLPL